MPTTQEIAAQRLRFANLTKATDQLWEEATAKYGADEMKWPEAVQAKMYDDEGGLGSMFLQQGDMPAFRAFMVREGRSPPGEAWEKADGTDMAIEARTGTPMDLTPVQQPVMQRSAAPAKTTPPAAAPLRLPNRSFGSATGTRHTPLQQEIARQRLAKMIDDFASQPAAEPLPKPVRKPPAPSVDLPDDPNRTGDR